MSSSAEVVFKAKLLAGLAELLAPCVEASDSGHGTPLDPGQVPLLLLSQGPTVDRATVLKVTVAFCLPIAGNSLLVHPQKCGAKVAWTN